MKAGAKMGQYVIVQFAASTMMVEAVAGVMVQFGRG
jgi:hypothetical protein